MSIPGDPFETNELDERRRRQRRHLRTLDRSLLDLVTTEDLPTLPVGADVAWLEAELRGVADLEMVHLVEVFRRCEDARAKTMVAHFVRENIAGDPDGALESLVDDLTAEASRRVLDGVSRRERIAIRRYLQLAAWADALSARRG